MEYEQSPIVPFDKETKKAARLCGTNVTRASLHNMDYIKNMHIGIGLKILTVWKKMQMGIKT